MKLDWKIKPLSWSAISSFKYSKQDWYEKYVLGIKPIETEEMKFGKMIGKKLETDPTFLPMIPRCGKMEHEFRAEWKGIPLIGFADSFNQVTSNQLKEYKTGRNKWDKRRVDEHGQLTMYCLMNYIMTKTKPEDVDISLTWMPTQRTEDGKIEFVPDIEKKIITIKTKRTMAQILEFGALIEEIYRQMEAYVASRELSTCTKVIASI